MRKCNHRCARGVLPALLLTALGFAGPAAAQTSLQLRDVQMRNWEGSMRKAVALANAMAAETYTWPPGEGVMERDSQGNWSKTVSFEQPGGSPTGLPTDARFHGTIIQVGVMGGGMQPQGHAQVLVNMIDFGMPVEEAVAAPRIHLERDLISIEPGFQRESVEALVAEYPEHHLWEEKNLFFGGAHTVTFDGSRFRGAGDPRRGGVFATC